MNIVSFMRLTTEEKKHLSTNQTSDTLSPPGARLRHVRKLRGMTMKEVATRAGLTESYVSKLERDLVSPSLNALHKICNALETNIGFLFSAEAGQLNSVNVVRANERVALQVSGQGAADGIQLESLIPSSSFDLLQVNIHIVQAGGGGHEAIQHKGQEFGLVLEGKLELTVDNQTINLGPGDAFSFESSLGHTYRNTGEQTAKVLWVNSPPTF